MSEDIRKYYSSRVSQADRNKFLWQVGKTIDGKEVSEDQLDIIVNTIRAKLKLGHDDSVLDVGCGNGLITKIIAGRVKDVVGIELTPELFDIAREYNQLGNISYINNDILYMSPADFSSKISKVYLYEVLQHMDYPNVYALINMFTEILNKDSVVFIGGILDEEKKWQFIDSYERRCSYLSALINKEDALGIWFHQDYLRCIGEDLGFNVECFPQERALYTSGYRFDCVLRKL